MEVLEAHECFSGRQWICRHRSEATDCDMTFSVFVPPQARDAPCPAVTFLSGLTCTHANVTEKGDYRRLASQLGLVVIAPDTSPRGEGTPDDPAFDMGQGAGFYLDATQPPWSARFRMESYVVRDLRAIIAREFPVDPGRQGLFGHSMGGHGALTLALRHPGLWRSVSAFAPIVAPTQVPWGQKAFLGYLGEDRDTWREHDAVELIRLGRRLDDLLVDIGEEDPFLNSQLRPELLESACRAAGQPLALRRRAGHDHSYYFISTFMEDHLRWHAEHLAA